MEVGRVSGENDYGAGRIGFQLTRVEFIAEADVKDSGNHGVNSILWMPVRHQLLTMRHFDPDGVRAGLRGLTHDDGQPDGRRERWERFQSDVFGQDGFEHLPARVGAAGLRLVRHTNLLARELSQIVSQPIFDIPRLVETARH